MEIRHLLYFKQICEDRNFNIASNKLFITQQALSKSMKNLENELGNQLFVKVPTGIELTPYAESIYPIVKQILQNFDAGIEKINSVGRDGVLPIRLAVSYQTMETVSHTLIDDFKKEHPNIKIVFDGYPDLIAEQQIDEGKADFLFSVRKPNNPCLNSYLLKKLKLCLMVSPQHALYNKDTIQFFELDGMVIHCAGPQFKTYHLLQRKATEANIQLSLIPTSGYLITTYQSIFNQNNCVIGILNSEGCPGFPQVKQIPFSDEELNWDIYLSHQNSRPLTSNEQSFLKFVLNLID